MLTIKRYKEGDTVRIRKDLATCGVPSVVRGMWEYAGREMVIHQIILSRDQKYSYIIGPKGNLEPIGYYWSGKMFEDFYVIDENSPLEFYNIVRDYYMQYGEEFSEFKSASEVDLSQIYQIVQDIVGIKDTEWFSEDIVSGGVYKLRPMVNTALKREEFVRKYDLIGLGVDGKLARLMGGNVKLIYNSTYHGLKYYQIEGETFGITSSYIEGTECQRVKDAGKSIYAEIARLTHDTCVIPTENNCCIDLLVKIIDDKLFESWNIRRTL